MGINVQAAESINTLNDFTNVVNEQSNSVAQSATGTCISSNVENVIVGGSLCAGNVNISGSTINIDQVNKNGCQLNVSNSVNITNQDYNQIKTAAQDFIKNQLESSQGWLAIGLNVQTSTSVSRDDIQNQIDNISVNNITQTCNSYIGSFNTGTLTLCADITNSTINVNQESQVTAVSQCVNTAILKNFFNTQELQEFAQNTDNYFKSQQKGIGSLFGWIVAIAAILAVVIIVGLILFFVFGGSKKAPEEIATGIAGVICEQRAQKAGLTGENKTKFVQECSVLENNILNRRRQTSGEMPLSGVSSFPPV